MALLTETKIFLNKKHIRFYENLVVSQEIGEHDYVKLVCNMCDIPEFDQQDQYLGILKDYIGTTMTIEIAPISEKNSNVQGTLTFKGIIVDIDEDWNDLTEINTVTFHAYSGTIMADRSSHYTSYQDISLGDIIHRTLDGYKKEYIQVCNNLNYTKPIYYSVQDGCSDFTYLKRLASFYGQWLYHDGQQLIIGKPSDEIITLEYGHHLKSMSLKMQPKAQHFVYHTNDYLLNETHEKNTNQIIPSSEKIQTGVHQKAKELYTKQYQKFDNHIPKSKELNHTFDTHITQHQKAAALQQVILKGVSDHPAVAIGSRIQIKNHGIYRIIKITHRNIHGGNYSNTFEAIEASTDLYPKMDITQTPKMFPQTAIVIDNNDPEKLGRAKVQFSWQKHANQTTPWIRIMTPSAGAEKGFHFIPEIHETVLIGFESGNAELPFIMGTMYHGKAKPSEWHTPTNNVKAIRTRSGHTIELNDTENGESISIYDKNGNTVHMDTANNHITITALENMVLNAKNLDVNVDENAMFTIGKRLSLSSGTDLDIHSKNKFVSVIEDLHVETGGAFSQITAKTEIQSDGDLSLSGGGIASFKGGNDVKISKG